MSRPGRRTSQREETNLANAPKPRFSIPQKQGKPRSRGSTLIAPPRVACRLQEHGEGMFLPCCFLGRALRVSGLRAWPPTAGQQEMYSRGANLCPPPACRALLPRPRGSQQLQAEADFNPSCTPVTTGSPKPCYPRQASTALLLEGVGDIQARMDGLSDLGGAGQHLGEKYLCNGKGPAATLSFPPHACWSQRGKLELSFLSWKR